MADCQAETNRRQVHMADLYTATGRQANTQMSGRFTDGRQTHRQQQADTK
jgi:hypothetical protein